MRRSQDDEQRVFVALDLRPLMGRSRILDCEIVEVELPLDFLEDLGVWFVEADPDELSGLLQRRAGVLELEASDAAAARIGGAIDDADGGFAHSLIPDH